MLKFKFNKKVLIISIVAIVIVALVITVFLLISGSTFDYDRLYKYEEKMEIYGFDTLYDNESSATKEDVTISEVLKLAICSSFNLDELWDTNEETYKNESYINYAKEHELLDYEISSENANDKIRYIDAIEIFYNAKIKLLKEEGDKTIDFEIIDLSKYTSEEQIYIKDLVSNEIINTNEIFGNRYTCKGQVNELVIGFAEKFDTIVMEGERLNINPEKLPSNYEDFPYIVTDIPKEVYEYDVAKDALDSYTPKELYKYKKDSFEEIDYISTEFLNTILNVDYRDLNEDSFKETINKFLIFEETDYLDKYLEYVKSNEIIIEGQVTPYLPILYFNGMSYNLRLNVKFKIVNYNKNHNLLCFDNKYNETIVYDENEYDINIDYHIQEVLGNTSFYMSPNSIYNSLLDRENVKISFLELEYDEELEEGGPYEAN